MNNQKDKVLNDVNKDINDNHITKSYDLTYNKEKWIYSLEKVSAFSALMAEEILDFKIAQSQNRAKSFTEIQESGGAESMMKIASYLIRRKTDDGFIEPFNAGITENESFKYLQKIDIKNYKIMKEIVVDFFTSMGLSQKLLSVWSNELNPLNNPTTVSLMKMFMESPNLGNLNELTTSTDTEN